MAVNYDPRYLTYDKDEVQRILAKAAESAPQSTTYTKTEVDELVDGKQDAINDLTAIREGATAGATAYQKPASGIPASDMAAAVQSSLGKADAAAPQSTTYTKSEVDATLEPIAEKAYEPSAFSGLGRVQLKKNIVEVSGTEKNVLTQDMLYKGEAGSRVPNTNTIFVVQYDYDLNGQTITVPAGCVLKFDGGSFKNGALKGVDTLIDSDSLCIKKDVTVGGTWRNEVIYTKWFDFVSATDGVTDNSVCFKQLQAVINGSKGCRVEFTKGYYQTQIIGMEPDAYVEVDGVTYPKWATNVYQADRYVVLNILEIPYLDMNLNGSTIKAINITCPSWNMIRINGVENAYVHDGELIGMASLSFTYPEYVNHANVIARNYEFSEGLIYQAGGFIKIHNIKCHNHAADGITVGSGTWYYRAGDVRPDGTPISQGAVQYPASGYIVENCEASYCGRNGITLHSSDFGEITNCHVHHIGNADNAVIDDNGIMARNPRSGIDVEFEDGQALKPVLNWENLYIHDCGAKSFAFAASEYSAMKEFQASNCRFLSLGLPSNMTADGNMAFCNCYFEYIGDGNLLGSKVRYIGCDIVSKAAGLLIGAATFDDCTITDAIEEETIEGYFFSQGMYLSVFNNCTITVKHGYGYLQNRTFNNCTLNFYKIGTIFAMGAEFYDCIFNDNPESESLYSFSLKGGNYASSTRGHIKISRCKFNKANGSSSAVSDQFLNSEGYPVLIEGCTFASLRIINGLYCKDLIIRGCTIDDLFINGNRQTEEGVLPVRIVGCEIHNLTVWVANSKEIDVKDSIVDLVPSTGSTYVLRNITFTRCIVTNKTARGSVATTFKDVAVKGIGSIFNFEEGAINTEYNLQDCYISGVVTEANFAGTAANCRWETPLATTGTTTQRPSANVSIGFQYFDTDLGEMIVWNGSDWIVLPKYEVVSALPASPDSNTLYLIEES